jgi:hypothetical protein
VYAGSKQNVLKNTVSESGDTLFGGQKSFGRQLTGILGSQRFKVFFVKCLGNGLRF